MKKLLTLLLTVVALNAHAWEQRRPLPLDACKVHSPYGFAKMNHELIPVCRQAYLSAYDPQAKIPGYVAYTLLPKNALGCVARTNAFASDQSVPQGPRADDYAGTGYDKGHMAPDGDLSWDQQVEFESFLMTNMAPQAGSLNRGIWKLLETAIRGWTVQLDQPYTIYVGGIYGPQDKKIGAGVIVPTAFYKIVINNTTQQVAGWMFPHVAPYPNLGNDLTKFRTAVSEIERIARIDFQFPANAQELQPTQIWPVNFGALTNSKRAKCGRADD